MAGDDAGLREHSAMANQRPKERDSATPAEQSWHALSAQAVVAAFQSDADRGLTVAEAAARLARVGPNRLRETAGPSALWRFAQQFNDLLIWVLLVAAAIAGLLGEWIDAVAIIAIVLLNAVLGFVQEQRAEQALAALRSLSAPLARVVRDGAVQSVPAADIVPGDVLELEAGDRLAADARLVVAYSLTVDEATLTGESVPVEKDARARLAPDTGLADRGTMLFAGTIVTTGRARAVVTATGMTTELGQLAGLVERAGAQETPLQRRLGQVGRWLVYVALAIVAVVFVLGLARGVEPAAMFLTAISLAVAAVPEGLPAVVTIVLAIGTQRMAKRRAIVRRLPAVEVLGSTTVICSDKTGTLTQNVMTVRMVWPPGQYQPAEVRDEPSALDERARMVLRAGGLASDARPKHSDIPNPQRPVGDPTEAAIVRAAAAAGLELDRDLTLVGELPFDSTRKRMTRLLRDQEGRVVAYVKGAPDVVLACCTHQVLPTGRQPLDEAGRMAAQAANYRLAEQGLRVLAVAERPDSPLGQVDQVERDLTLLGLIGLQDPPRPEARPAIAACRTAGIRPVMITGDQARTARAIGAELGLLVADEAIITGAELDRMDDDALREAVPALSVYARVTGEHKLRIVRAWQQRGEVVAMTGDGVNDAPAIKEADIGVAMGITGTDVTREASDIVLADDNFATIVAAVEEGRVIADNIRKVLRFLLSCNAAEILVVMVAVALGLPLPLLAVQILWMNLVTDSLPALALGLEPAERDVMSRSPAPPGAPLMDAARIRDMLIEAAVMAAAALAAFGIALTLSYSLDTARTMAFTTLVLAQLWQALNSRSERWSLVRLGVTSNLYLALGLLVAVLLQLIVVYLPFAWPVFKTVPLTLMDLGICMVSAALVWLAVELRKLVLGWLHRW